MTLSFTGLGLVIASSEWAFNVIKWLGAGYLIYLGVKAFTSKQESYHEIAAKKKANRTWQSYFVSGFIVGASNPKAIVFFTALFHNLLTRIRAFNQYLIFAATFIVFELSWLLLYSYLGSSSSRWLLKKGRAKLFNRLTGGVFIGAGALLSVASKG